MAHRLLAAAAAILLGCSAPAHAQSAAAAPSDPLQPFNRAMFDFNKAVLKPSGKRAIDKQISEYGPGDTVESVIVTGHTDRIGSVSYNKKLSQRRADAVKKYLLSKGIPATVISTEAKGKSEPVTGDKCRKMGKETFKNKKLVNCLAPDRRVTIDVKGKTTPK